MGSKILDKFIFGVATAGFQIEGGYNGKGEPANNWVEWESLGKVEPSGIAIDFWNRYEEYLDISKDMGLDSFRLSVEWARIEPEPGIYDEKAINHYKQILNAIRSRGLIPLVTFHHFCHPAWLGVNFWLSDEAPALFAKYVRKATSEFRDYCSFVLTINEPNVLYMGSYLLGTMPPGEIGKIKHSVSALDNLLTAHILAYQEIKNIIPDSLVSFNNTNLSPYELDKGLVDVLLSKKYNVKQTDLSDWLRDRRKTYYSIIDSPNKLEDVLRTLITKFSKFPWGLKKTLDALAKSPHESVLDYIGIDFYNPPVANHLWYPGKKTAGGRAWVPSNILWDDEVNNERFFLYAKANAEQDMPFYVIENGLCNRVKNGRSYPRLDGFTRPLYLEKYLNKLIDIKESKVNLKGYFHWTLADNYEWGSYQPRFGIIGIDRERGIKILETDSMGYNSKDTYKKLIKELRNKL